MTKNEIYFSSFVYLLHRITNNLRFLFLDIKDTNLILISYFESSPSAMEKELIEDVGNDIVSITEYQHDVRCEYHISDKPFALISKSEYLLFARYEKDTI